MPLNHESATAKLLIDGLAICCFNPRARVWEVGYMRHPEHELGLDLGDGSDLRVIPREARVIRIETLKGKTPAYESEFPLGFFERGPVPDRKRDEAGMSTDEKENFRWAMNLDEGTDVPHGQIKLKPPPYPVTMAYISDAVFYAAALTAKNLFLLPLRENPAGMSAAALEQQLYGKTADQIGADMRCAEGGGIRITIDDEELPLLPHRPGNPWQIMLMNMRPFMMHDGGHRHTDADVAAETTAGSNLEQGDFQIYYDALDVTGEEYSLWGYASHMFSGRTDCNTPWVGGTSLKGLVSK
ncbi:MAG: hypothetical protein ACJ74T_09005 [Pyrinomonadaceae bacterium]